MSGFIEALGSEFDSSLLESMFDKRTIKYKSNSKQQEFIFYFLNE